LIRFLSRSAALGSPLLAAGIFIGLLAPALAHALRSVLLADVLVMTVLVLMRVDIAATFALLRRPLRLGGMVAFHLLACPVIAWLVVLPLHLDPGIAAGVVIFATGCALLSGSAFARLLGLDPELALLVMLATTLLVPLTAPPIVAALTGVNLAIGLFAFMFRLALMVGIPALVSTALRRTRLMQSGPVLDGALVWLLVVYGIGVMDGLTARLLADPGWVVQATIAAFAVDFGLNAITTLAFARAGWREAASAGLISGNRNMALYLAVLPAAADPRIGLFFAICQFPTFLSPFLLQPVLRLFRRAR